MSCTATTQQTCFADVGRGFQTKKSTSVLRRLHSKIYLRTSCNSWKVFIKTLNFYRLENFVKNDLNRVLRQFSDKFLAQASELRQRHTLIT